MPDYLISWSTNKAVLRNYEGVITTYEEPANYKTVYCDLNCKECRLHLKMDQKDNCQSVGIEKLLSDNDTLITLTPQQR